MNRLYFVLFVLTLFSCSEKTVQLPETNNKDVLKVNDVSSVYMFFNEETDSLDFNRRNMISSTNWLVAVDKRLSLKQTLPHLKYLQEKRHGDGLHKNEAAKNYFSCSNTELKTLSFIEFTDIVYHDEPIIEFITDMYTNSSDLQNNIFINFLESDSLVVGTQLALKGIPKNEFVSTIDSISSTNTIENKVFLTFKDNLTFQDYISYKTLILNIKSENVTIANDEFIYK